MKKCPCCGAPSGAESELCDTCANELFRAEPQSATGDNAAEQELFEYRFIDLTTVDAFELRDGFSRPLWDNITKAVEAKVKPDDREAAWTEAALQWIMVLRNELGGSYRVIQSKSFILLSPLGSETNTRILSFADRCVEQIHLELPGIAWNAGSGKHVILLFSEEDDYYQYIAGFYQSDQMPRSLGIHLFDGYSHCGICHLDETQTLRTLAHELTHDCVAHLPLPRWLNEGVAVTLDKHIAGSASTSDYWTVVSRWKPPVMWDELAEKHDAFWNETTIQQFWAGTSFDVSQNASELSYSLAEVLVQLLSKESGFLGFVENATWEDGGQTAAMNTLGTDLGQTAATFLGDGDWRPNRKEMVDCWNSKKLNDLK